MQCTHCQRRVLQSFASLAGIALRPARTRPVWTKPALIPLATARSRYLTSDAIQTQTDEAVKQDHLLEALDDTEETQRRENATKTEADNTLPWYLQAQNQQQTVSPLSERQKLPDVPEEAPEKLRGIMEHISVDIGLEDIRLLDLRHLDPPPALGGNLIMLLGTARSERHLHVAADRFCKWLRSHHSLKPYPDGLLGKNELKLKLRRKARRAKLMGGKGPDAMDADDGLRTGWICVNVGAIAEGQAIDQAALDQAGVVGFNNQEEGVHLVVQMMTEERREALDLETLWIQTSQRQERKEERDAEQDEEERAADQEVRLPAEQNGSAHADVSSVSFSRVQHPSRSQIRHLHSSRKLQEQSLARPQEDSFQDLTDVLAAINMTTSRKVRVMPATAQGLSRRLEIFWSKQYPIKDPAYKERLGYFKNMSPDEAFAALGQGINDTDTTSFLRWAFAEMPGFPDDSYWSFRLSIACAGLLFGHPGYTREAVAELFKEVQRSLPVMPEYLFEIVLDAFVPIDPDGETPIPQHPPLRHEELRFLCTVVEHLWIQHPRTAPAYTFEILALASVRCGLIERNLSERTQKALVRLTRALDEHTDISAQRGAFHVNVLSALAVARTWALYWFHWHGLSLRMQPHTPGLYELMFRHVANDGDLVEARKTLVQMVPAMEREEPPVEVEGEVAEALMGLLMVADPFVQRQAHTRANEQGEFVRLWRRCEAGLVSSGTCE